MRQKSDFIENRELERELLAQPEFSSGTLNFVGRLSAKHTRLWKYAFQSENETKSLIVKQQAHGPNSAKVTLQEFANLKRVQSLLDTGLIRSVPEALLVLPGKGILVTSQVPGVPFSLILKRYGNRVVGPFRSSALRETAERVGAWLRVFQNATRGESLPFSRNSYLSDVELWLSEARRKGFKPELAREILQQVSCYTEPLNGRLTSVSGKHGDFIAQNILVADKGIGVVDFEGFADGQPIYEDLGMFLAYILLLKSRGFYSRRSLNAVRHGFLQGFLSGDEIDGAFLNIYILKSAVRIIGDGPPTTGNWNRVGAAHLWPRLLKDLAVGKSN